MRNLDEQLEGLRRRQRYRTLRSWSERRGAEIVIEGRRLIDFASNDSLGLAQDERVTEALCQAARRFGVGAGASRLLSGASSLHREFEAFFADFKGTRDALLVGSGYLAGTGLIPALAQGQDALIASDEHNHASLIDGCRLARARVVRYRHADAADSARALDDAPAGDGERLLVSESVFSMQGDHAPLTQLGALAAARRTRLVIDDAHATGVFGPQGRGLAHRHAEIWPGSAAISTLGKALGVAGAVITGDAALIDWLRNTMRPLIFSTAPPLPLVAAAWRAIEISLEEPERRESALRTAAALRDELTRRGLSVLPGHGTIIGVLRGSEAKALDSARRCLDNSLYLPAIRPPTVPSGSCRLRISVTAMHRAEHCERLANVLAGC